MPVPSAAVYIDGFNLYRRALAGRPASKWLDVQALCDLLLPTFDVVQVRYFSARIKFVEGADPRSPSRQHLYLRALATRPRVSVHLGTFRSDRRWMARSPLEYGEDGLPIRVRVRKIEEKGTDVGLAAHMVRDAMVGMADVYFLLSNDSDFVEAMRIVRDDASAEIGLITPVDAPAAGALLAVRPHHLRVVRRRALEASQLPARLRDEDGTITRPRAWNDAGTPPGGEVPVPGPRTQDDAGTRSGERVPLPVAEASGVVRRA